MNWKSEAIQKLTEYESRKAALLSIPEEIERLKSSARSIRAATADATPVPGGGSKREEVLLSNIVYREELERKLTQNKKWVSVVERSLTVLTPSEYRVLEVMYIRNIRRGAVDLLCDELHIEKPTVYRWRDDALLKFTMALYGIER